MVNRFDYDYNSSEIINDLWIKKTSNNKSLNDSAFRSLAKLYSGNIKALLKQKKWRQIMENKSLSHMFLDKVGKIISVSHPINIKVQSYGYSSSLVASMELMHYLHEVIRDPRLTEESRKILSDWIVSESVYLPVAAVLDGWRIGAFKGLLSSQKINEPPKASDTKVNSEEIRQFAAAIADHISNMKPGESFKMLGGHFSHETRFVVVRNRNEDGTFTAYHYDTGGGFGYKKTALKIFGLDAKRLQELDFWQKFISLKVTEDGMSMMNGLIRGLGKKENLSKELCKPVQYSNSCPFHAVEAEFKHTFVSHHRDLQVGLEQYKICTALMAEHAKNFESKTTDPALKDVFLAKEKIRHRYLNWVEIAQNQEQYERVKNQYIDAIKKMEKDGQFESNIRRLPPSFSDTFWRTQLDTPNRAD